MRFLLLIRGAAEDEPDGALAPAGTFVGGELDEGPTAGALDEDEGAESRNSASGNCAWLLVVLKASILRATTHWGLRRGPGLLCETPLEGKPISG
jgi:hypothetical protein